MCRSVGDGLLDVHMLPRLRSFGHPPPRPPARWPRTPLRLAIIAGRRSPFSSAPQDNISLSDAAMALLQAKNSYEADLGAIKVADEIQKSTLRLIA
jgi:hypothetical protein